MNNTDQLIKFIQYSEQLKLVIRNSWLSDNKTKESVAEHSWRMALMAMLIAPKTKLKLNMERVLKMILVHDLVEIETGDMPTILQIGNAIRQKQESEQNAILLIKNKLDEPTGQEIYELWTEFEEQRSIESIYAKIIDKFECIIQKNQQSVDMEAGADGYFEKLVSKCKIDSYLETMCLELWEESKKRNYLPNNRTK